MPIRRIRAHPGLARKIAQAQALDPCLLEHFEPEPH